MQPFHGPKERWRDVLKLNLQSFGISDGCWYDRARDRKHLQQLYLLSVDDNEQEYLHAVQMQTMHCTICQRYCRTEGDKACHKCIDG